VAQKPLDTKDNTLNVECKVAIAPLCIVTATERSVEEFWSGDSEISVLKEVLDEMGFCRLTKNNF